MTNKDEIIETGWNLDNSYASLPKSLFTISEPDSCTFTEVDHS